jgi:hypothetical protein
MKLLYFGISMFIVPIAVFLDGSKFSFRKLIENHLFMYNGVTITVAISSSFIKSEIL